MELKRINSAEDPLFKEAFALYESSFPEYEKRYYGKQTALMKNPLYHFEVIMEANEFAGILLYWESSFYSYIEHFAILKSIRGKALGSRALEAFCGKRSCVILEIDPPRDEISTRREGFYRRLGFKRNNYAHTHPAYRKQFPPHELVVMSYPNNMVEREYELFRLGLVEIVMKDADD